MKIAVMGTGHVGGALGPRLAQSGHDVCFGSRSPESDKVRELCATAPGLRGDFWKAAAEEAEVVLLAAPWSAAEEVTRACAPWQGRVLIDCINPLKPDLSGLDLHHGVSSASQQLAAWAPEARIVKAFNTASAATMANPDYGGQPATLFFCGDDEAAKAIVAQLGSDLGFDPVDAGPLGHAAHLESLAMLYIHLAIHGWGANCAFRMLKR